MRITQEDRELFRAEMERLGFQPWDGTYDSFEDEDSDESLSS